MEDERRLAAAVRRGLMAEGFAVDLAHNGEDGLHAAREGGYDAVVLDLMLPKVSGYAVCQQLRADENWVPILILSAKDGEYDQADGLDLGADDYLVKPFSYVVLAARLRALLRRGAVPRPALLRAGDLVLDPASHRVRRSDADVPLTAREFAVLEYLMRGRARWCPSPSCSSMSGTATTRATSTWSRCTWATCGARSTCRLTAAPCRRCAGLATGWPRTAADRWPSDGPGPAAELPWLRESWLVAREARMPRRIACWLALAAASVAVLWVGWIGPAGRPATLLTRVDVVTAVLILAVAPWPARRRFGPTGTGWLARAVRVLGYAAVFALLLVKAEVERRDGIAPTSHAELAGAWTGEIVFLLVLAAYAAGLLAVTAQRPPAGHTALAIGTVAGVAAGLVS